MKDGDGGGQRQAKDRARVGCATAAGGSVQVSIGGLEQAGVWRGAIAAAGERMEDGEGAGGCDSENRTQARRASKKSCPVEVPIAGLDQRPCWNRACRVSLEVMKHCQGPRSGHPEDRADAE